MEPFYAEYVEVTLSGLWGGRANPILCRVVSSGLRFMPDEVRLKDLCAQVAAETGKQEAAVYKALGRAVHTLWEQGDRARLESLMGYRLVGEEPPLKELVTELIRALWERSVRVEYRIQEGGLDRRVGICGREVCLGTGRERVMVMAPFSRDREAVTALTGAWNQKQLPLEQFRDMILLGQLREKED